MPGEGLPPAAMPAPLNPEPFAPITYEGQSTCESTPKAGAVRMEQIIKGTYGANQFTWIPRKCEQGGQSEHKEGRAIDWMVDVRDPAQRANAEAFLNWLLGPDAAGRVHGHAYQLGVMYIGWHDRIWRGYKPENGWTELKGCFSKPEKKNDNYCHRNHIHISLTWAGANGVAVPAPEPVAPEPAPEPVRPPAPAQPGPDNDEFMSIGSELGYFTDEASPLEPGEVRTVNLPPVPLNATSALVSITTRDATKAGKMRVGMVDAKSAVAVKVKKKRTTTQMLVVPVADGAVQLAAPDKGAVHVRLDVLGYTVDGAKHPAVGAPAVKVTRAKFTPDQVQVLKVRGLGPVPKKAKKVTAVILKVTAKGKGAAGRFAAYPVGGADLGTTSAPINAEGKTSSIIVSDIGTDGQIALASSVDAKVRVDVVGFVRG